MNETVRVMSGQVLVVSIDAAAPDATVWLDGTDSHWIVSAASPLRLGQPGVYRIESTGTYLATITSASAPAITTGKKMSLADKMKRLAERTKQVPTTLEAIADDHLSRLDALEQRGTDSFAKLHTVLTDTEAGISAAEDALNQLTNGDPNPGPLPS